jgi:RNA polymerase sigma factor (sigma-70 family)
MSADLKSAYLLHRSELARYVNRHLGDRHAVADVVHDAFVRMADQPLTKVQDVRSYLYQIARNLLLDQKKRNFRRQTFVVSPETLDGIIDEAPSPEDAADARLRLERLQNHVRELPFKTQQIFVLNRIDGLSYGEVARHLGISESSVQKHLAHAVQHIALRTPSR